MIEIPQGQTPICSKCEQSKRQHPIGETKECPMGFTPIPPVVEMTLWDTSQGFQLNFRTKHSQGWMVFVYPTKEKALDAAKRWCAGADGGSSIVSIRESSDQKLINQKELNMAKNKGMRSSGREVTAEEIFQEFIQSLSVSVKQLHADLRTMQGEQPGAAEDELDEETPKTKRKPAKVVDEDDEEDLTPKSKNKAVKDEEEDDEEETPKSKRKAAKDDENDEEEEAPKKKGGLTRDDVKKALRKLKDSYDDEADGRRKAIKLLKKSGGVEDVMELPEKKFAAVIEACEEAAE